MSSIGAAVGGELTQEFGDIEPVRRQVIRTSEYNDVAIPLDLVISAGKLDIYPELTRSNVLRTYSKDGHLLLQAGGLVGFIPLNDKLAIEIEPRVPIGNLERILLLAGNAAPVVLAKHLGNFNHSSVGLPNSLLDVLSDRLATLTEACWNEGLHSEYERQVTVGQSPTGRLDVYATVQCRVRTRDPLATVSGRFYRTHDTGPNRCIAAALGRLHYAYSSMKDRAGARAMAARLRKARQLLGHITSSKPADYERHPLVIDPTRLPASRPSYAATVALAKVVLAGEGIELRSRAGQVTLPPMMIRMETTFEAYLRSVLAANDEQMLAFDGNLDPPEGAAAKLFHSAPSGSSHSRVRSTPDVVLREAMHSGKQVVIDAKYKLDVSRDDINQVLGYALTYQTNTVMLASPRKSDGASRGLLHLGQVNGVNLYSYIFDLGSSNLEEEEALFRTAAQELLASARPLTFASSSL